MKIYNIKRKMISMNENAEIEKLYSIGIVWNMGNKFADEIVLKVAQSFEVIDIKKYDLGDVYENFVLDCYKDDDEAFLEGYIYEKIKNMKRANNNKIVLFLVKITEPTYKLNVENGNYQCAEIKSVKYKIREEFSSKIEGYFFDNLIHMTDNVEEYERVNNVIKKYNQYIET